MANNFIVFLDTESTEAGVIIIGGISAADALGLLGLDADLPTFSVPANTTISPFGATLVDDAAATNARDTLELGAANSPTFTTVKLSGLTDDYIPYHVNDATGLANGPTKTDVDSAVSLKHASGSDNQDLSGLMVKAQNLSDVGNAATAFGNIKQAATTSATGVIKVATSTTLNTGTATDEAATPSTLSASMYGYNYAKARLINEVYGIVTPANVKGFWIFDETGAVDHIHGKETIGGETDHAVTFRNASLAAINASTCSPGHQGFAPYLTMDATHIWDTPDSTDFSYGDGAGNDTAFSVLVLANVTDMTDIEILSKGSVAGGFEWALSTYNLSDKLALSCLNPAGNIVIGRYYNTALTSQEGTFHTYGGTYSGSKAASGLKVYNDGVQIDDTDLIVGSYAGMTNGTGVLGNYLDVMGTPFYIGLAKYSVVLVVAEELTAVQMARLNVALQGFAGQFS